uniref:Coiled-coil domain-containing protein 170 n=1 Tax=Knipowitschia caucasica TaxID=637954 RepID=A0AAV2JEG0_KNICA
MLVFFVLQAEQCNERERLRMRIALLEASVKSCELETRSSRETVQRLMSDLDQERRKTANSAAALDSLKVEYEALLCGKRITESEKLAQCERLEAGKRVIDAAKRESQCLERQAISDVDTELQRVSAELQEQTELTRRTLQRTDRSQNLVQDLTERLHRLERELQRAGEHRDGLQQDKQHYEEFLEKLSEILKVETIALDVGFDLRLNLIVSRAEQLMRQEGDALVQSKSLSYSLQRKVKCQKEQLESKALHIQLLRKKVLELEDSAVAAQREEEKVENKRLQKKVERLQTELRAFRLSSTELKAQLSHSHELKVQGRGVRTGPRAPGPQGQRTVHAMRS